MYKRILLSISILQYSNSIFNIPTFAFNISKISDLYFPSKNYASRQYHPFSLSACQRETCINTQHDPSIYLSINRKISKKRTYRSVRESVPAVPRQTDQKEEDLCEEEHSVPGVQRDPGVRRARGEHRGRQPHSESDRLRQVRERQDRRIIQI